MGYNDSSWPSNAIFESFFAYKTNNVALIVPKAVAVAEGVLEEATEGVPKMENEAEGVPEEMMVGDIAEGVQEEEVV